MSRGVGQASPHGVTITASDMNTNTDLNVNLGDRLLNRDEKINHDRLKVTKASRITATTTMSKSAAPAPPVAPILWNPFYVRGDGGRNNFPDLDHAFQHRHSSPRNEDHSSHASRQAVDDADNNNDDDAEEEDERSSILNMSIGARSSLNEHLRFVERFGIDGEMSSSLSNHKKLSTVDNSNQGDGEVLFSNSTPTQILDDQWDNLLNTSTQIDPNNSLIGVTGPLQLMSQFQNNDTMIYNYPRLGATEDSIEILHDTSSDYFNSSRVQLLATPERHKNKRLDMVMTRDVVHAASAAASGGLSFDNSLYGSEAGSSFCCLSRFARDQHTSHGSCSSPTTTHHLHHYERGTLSEIALNTTRDTDYRNSSFQSFQVAELSRISNACSDIVHHTPDTSFQHHGHLVSTDHHDICTHSPTIGIGYSPMRNVDSSFNSILIATTKDGSEFGLEGRYDDDENFLHYPTTTITPTSHHTESKERVFTNQQHPSMVVGGTTPKESTMSSSPDSNTTSNSVHSAMSSIMAEAHCLMKNIATEVELSMGALETFQQDFLKAIDIVGRPSDDPPSPISQVGSTTTTTSSSLREQENGSSSKSSGERSRCSRNNVEDVQTTTKKTTTTTSTTKKMSPQQQRQYRHQHDPLLTGRKRFRTVVPRRVYLDSLTGTTPDEEQDSFFAVQSNPETTSVKKSLLESFEEALRNTF
jgi:hypothetical protein